MSGNLYIFSILLGTVLLSAILHETETVDTTSDSTIDLTLSTGNPSATSANSEATTTAETNPATSTPPATEASSTGFSTEADQSSSTSQTSTTDKGTEEAANGLTPAEAAGVAVGTIAGVAALGGGIFAGLKFSGKLG